MGKNQKMKRRSQCAKKVTTVKKNQTWKAISPIWKRCQTSLVMTVNGPSVKSNPSTWVRSNAKPINACFTVWKVSWSKATEKPNVKRTKMVNGNSTRNSVHVSNVVMTAQKSRCQKCQRGPKMKKNQKTKKKNQKNPCATMKTKIVKKNQKNLCATMKTKIVKKNQITMRRSQCAKKVKTVKKNQTWKAISPIWKRCQTSLVMTVNGPSVKSNPSTWVRSNAKPIN